MTPEQRAKAIAQGEALRKQLKARDAKKAAARAKRAMQGPSLRKAPVAKPTAVKAAPVKPVVKKKKQGLRGVLKSRQKMLQGL